MAQDRGFWPAPMWTPATRLVKDSQIWVKIDNEFGGRGSYPIIAVENGPSTTAIGLTKDEAKALIKFLNEYVEKFCRDDKEGGAE